MLEEEKGRDRGVLKRVGVLELEEGITHETIFLGRGLCLEACSGIMLGI